MVQVGTQRRSSEALGQASPVRAPPASLAPSAVPTPWFTASGKASAARAPTPVPPTVDYDLWGGATLPGSADARGNCTTNGTGFGPRATVKSATTDGHMIDVGRWGLGQSSPAPRAMSIGGRFGFDDGGETPNTQVAIARLSTRPADLRNPQLPRDPGVDGVGKFRGTASGIVIACEGGYLASVDSGTAAFDNADRRIKEFRDDREPRDLDTTHLANFVAAVRDRDAGELRAEALEGHVSAAGSHMANISHRLGKQAPPEEILDTIRGNREFSDAFERCREYLRNNGVDLGNTEAVVGPWVTFDSDQERFVGEFADRANALSRRDYRGAVVVPWVS